MIHFQQIDLNTFRKEYWQKKPLVIRNALPNFINPVSPDELAGLALEEDLESRIVSETNDKHQQWHLKRGPFVEMDFAQLPKTHWTLLVQGVDKVVPEVYDLLQHFDFIPQWRIDDVMISYASQGGSVGPHYDNYDVFLYQAVGRREWRLTSQSCTPDNYIPDLELRIMNDFVEEQNFILEEGDMLYLPPHIGHYGISLSDDCMTYSFGYRSYPGNELLDSLSEYVLEHEQFKTLYKDPDWSTLKNTSEILPQSWKKAQELLSHLISDEQLIKSWFGCFATRLDQSAEQHLPQPIEEDVSLEEFMDELSLGLGLYRDASCRLAYIDNRLFINGCEWDAEDVDADLISLIANNRSITFENINPFLTKAAHQLFLFDLWKLNWLVVVMPED